MYLAKETQILLEKRLGKSMSEIRSMNFDEEIAFIECKCGKRPQFSPKVDHRRMSRGDPLLAQGCIITKETEEKWFKKKK